MVKYKANSAELTPRVNIFSSNGTSSKQFFTKSKENDESFARQTNGESSSNKRHFFGKNSCNSFELNCYSEEPKRNPLSIKLNSSTDNSITYRRSSSVDCGPLEAESYHCEPKVEEDKEEGTKHRISFEVNNCTEANYDVSSLLSMTDCSNYNNNDRDSDCSSQLYETSSLPGDNAGALPDIDDINLSDIGIGDIPPPEAQFIDSEDLKEIDELSNCSNDCPQQLSDEDSYDINNESVEELPGFTLNSSGRIYSTIMEEPEEDNSSIPYIDGTTSLERPNITDQRSKNIDNNHDNELAGLEVCDSLLTPPPEPDMWRMSGTSCNTGMSSNTDCSDETLAQNMSELSSVNSFLSEFAVCEDGSNRTDTFKDECIDLDTPKVSPIMKKKKKKSKNISDAISRLEDIELTAQNLLKKKVYKDPSSSHKTERSSVDKLGEKLSNGKVIESKHSHQKRKKKAAKLCDTEKDKKPVYWLKPDNIKPYISRESYNEDLAETPEGTLKRSFQESDLNDYLDELDNGNEINGCLSDDSLNTLNNKETIQNGTPRRSKDKIQKREPKLKKCEEISKNELLKDIDYFLELSDLHKSDNSPDTFDSFRKMEGHINNVNRAGDRSRVVKSDDTNNDQSTRDNRGHQLEEETFTLKDWLESGHYDLPAKMKKSPKSKKKGGKSKKSKKSDKSVIKSPDLPLDAFPPTNNDRVQCDSLNRGEIPSQVIVSTHESSDSVSINRAVHRPQTSPHQEAGAEFENSRNGNSSALSNKTNEKTIFIKELDLDKMTSDKCETGAANMRIPKAISGAEVGSSWFNLVGQDEGIANNGNTRKMQIYDEQQHSINRDFSKSEKEIIADISNNLWNNYSFEEDNNLFFSDRFAPLPPIQEALSDDYSIPQTPETRSICLGSVQQNKSKTDIPEYISNKNEATILDNECADTTKIDDTICQIQPCKVKDVIDKFENQHSDIYCPPRSTCEQEDAINNPFKYKNLDHSDLNSSKTAECSLKIDDLSYYSDEMLKLTEAMERDIKSDEERNIKKHGQKKSRKKETHQFDSSSYFSKPPGRTKTRSELNKLDNVADNGIETEPTRSVSSIIKKFNYSDNIAMVPNESPFSAPPIVYMSTSHENVAGNEDEKVNLGVPIHYEEKMPPVVVNELKSILHGDYSREKKRQSLKDVCKNFDLALAGIDEPSLLDEIQQLLGFEVRHENDEVQHTKEEIVSKRTHTHKHISDQHQQSQFKSSSSTNQQSQFKSSSSTNQQSSIGSPPAPPKRTPARDFTAVLSEKLPLQQPFPVTAASPCELQLSTPATPPVPPKPHYKATVTVENTQNLHNFYTQGGRGVWSPGSAPVSHAAPPRPDTPDLPSFKDVPAVWTPVRGGSSSPSSNKREYRKIAFDGPTVPKRAHQQESRNVPRPEESFAWQGKAVELNKFETPNLPRVPNATVTLLQKKRDDVSLSAEGLIQDHKPDYIKPDDPSYYKPGDKLYTIKKEYESEDEEFGQRKFAILGHRKIEGVGPTTREGMPTSLKTGVKSEHQGEWYRRMFDSLHKVKDDSNTKCDSSKVRYGGYSSEPGYDSDAGVTRYAKYDRSKNEFEFENAESSVRRKTKRYVHQPGRIENYVPGFSSLSERELRENPQSDVKLEITTPRPSRQTFQGVRRLGSGYKESGYDSDSTLVFKKREDTRRRVIDAQESSEIYKEIQRGGDIPLSGLQRPAPRPKASPPNKYETSEVNIHYRTPIRVERKEVISDEELARRQEEHMNKVYEQERRKKYLSELEDIERRRHTDNFTPLQKSPIPLNRYDDEAYGGLRCFKTPEPRQLAKTLFSFHAQNKRELNFNKGDIITIRRHIDKNWMEGEFKGNIGIFPSNYVEILPFDNYKAVPRRPSEGQARVRFNFQAQTSLEMSLNKGDIIVLTRRVDENWFEGRIAMRKGIFPVSYVDVLQEPFGGDASPIPDTLSRPALPPPHLLFNGTSSVNSPYSTLGHHGNQTDNKGSFSQLTVSTQQEPISYRALYNYKPQNDDELELLEGDMVMVMEKCDDGWFVGTSQRTNCFGTFPGNYVEKA